MSGAVVASRFTPAQINDSVGRNMGLKQDERTSLAHVLEMRQKGVLSHRTVMEVLGFDAPEPPPRHNAFKKLEVADDGRFIVVGAQSPVVGQITSVSIDGRELPNWEPMDVRAEDIITVDMASGLPADELHAVVMTWGEVTGATKLKRKK